MKNAPSPHGALLPFDLNTHAARRVWLAVVSNGAGFIPAIPMTPRA